ncbi:hypothetical protein CPB84DRAFT_1748964 [Gymnopilus junonius]|uniref:Uncharacterized protein n=1 Tax=Gymnopilus junonius TaxID=109634 RepID=A0A9P5TLV0_GYMJU|nr:hypothetical protein CPB84DRAFT_1748964 [Gymnopilus junonius]
MSTLGPVSTSMSRGEPHQYQHVIDTRQVISSSQFDIMNKFGFKMQQPTQPSDKSFELGESLILPRAPGLGPEISRDAIAVTTVPRLPEFSSKDLFHVIKFSVNGMPGPYIHELARGTIRIDGANDRVFEAFGWKTIKFQISWPGFEFKGRRLNVRDMNGEPMRRDELASIIASQIYQFLSDVQNGKITQGTMIVNGRVSKSWDIKKISIAHLRLLGMNYYRSDWVPVLALDN